MAMLSEPRKKTKYRLQPFSGFSKINKRCDDDTSSFGFKLMASMGWAPGKGLGLNESGNIDPIKLRLKNDDAGLGYKVSEDDALVQQSEFQALLMALNSGSQDGEVESGDLKKKSKKLKLKSLEKQSEQSTKRVHYKKFTRSKDLSRASEQDLRSILGITSNDPKVKNPEEEEPEQKAPEPVEDSAFNQSASMYITAGSSVDYFKQRWLEKKSTKRDSTAEEEISLSNDTEEESNNDKKKRRSVTWGDVDVSYVEKYIKDMVDSSGSVNESLNDSECLEEPPTKKKKKKKNKQPPAEILENVEEPVQLETEKKKKKKRKLCEEDSLTEIATEEQENHTAPKKKKKQKVEVDQDELASEVNNFVDSNDTEALFAGEEINSTVDLPEETKQKKKKKKKKRNQVHALTEQTE